MWWIHGAFRLLSFNALLRKNCVGNLSAFLTGITPCGTLLRNYKYLLQLPKTIALQEKEMLSTTITISWITIISLYMIRFMQEYNHQIKSTIAVLLIRPC
jgi:hypothetical protein